MSHIKKAVSIVSRIQIYQACFHGTSLHLTGLIDDISLCSYLVEHTYPSAFYNNCDDQKTVVILVILFECVVAIM